MHISQLTASPRIVFIDSPRHCSLIGHRPSIGRATARQLPARGRAHHLILRSRFSCLHISASRLLSGDRKGRLGHCHRPFHMRLLSVKDSIAFELVGVDGNRNAAPGCLDDQFAHP